MGEVAVLATALAATVMFGLVTLVVVFLLLSERR